MAEPRRSGRGGLGGLGHLARRTLDSLRGGAPSSDEDAAIRALLSEAEWSLYQAMMPTDRRHAVDCAAYILTAGGSDELAAASALHDVGKIDAQLKTAGRVAASILTLVMGRARATNLKRRRGVVGRIGSYVNHPRRGAELLNAAGSSPLAQHWALTHHDPIEQSSIPSADAVLLWDADRA